jgi:hypothetical protein
MNSVIVISNGLKVLETQMVPLIASLRPYEFLLLLITLLKSKPQCTRIPFHKVLLFEILMNIEH